ncbi:hypothetical protein AB0X56_09545 [Weissella paramesenteroides]|uniref:hypothetical protein n=1 Tax=Weissella paramesenteroides TaxID=1249 RepID=UPI003F26ED23
MLEIDKLKTIERMEHQPTAYVYVAFDKTFSTIRTYADKQADLHKQVLAMQAQKAEIFWLGRLSKAAWDDVMQHWQKGVRLQDCIVLETVRGWR